MYRAEEENARPPLLNLLIMVTLLTIVVSLYYLIDYYLVRDGSNGKVTWFAPNQSCELSHAPCSAELGRFGRITLALDGDISPLTPLGIRVITEDVAPEGVEVDFIGRHMDMGVKRSLLTTRDAPTQARQHWSGEGQLGFCSSATMAWRAQVIVTTERGRLGSWFDFDSHPPASTAEQLESSVNQLFSPDERSVRRDS
ncbi:hypothetical protein Q4589_07840 [Cobetia marina]|jgi:hypothetical protein|uniref:hypothetical protein n=1 Tax=Cobetia TaxID=204286 RepID=UPI000864F9EE|nr:MULTISPECIES: hypothetical protein [Cobetia]AOM02602.1 hypothetical protein BFX80_16765 [Cobetia marina]MDA5563925.1 hypothetical protein [Cobetia sp. MMG027]MDH2291803.1 hypothetical protein [Cobetia sp. 10Alg 146]MDH2374339.1 hypothetical protein [Cobetia sp. 3AK]MDI6004473.1 hypothetical protein [Cobetia pacifica]